jgi:cytidine deaminase
MKNKDLLKYALEALKNSYSPYSNYKVGAAILLKNGKIVKGTNIENASYGLTNCAERTAMFAALAQGYKKEDFKELAIFSSCNPPASPCGACRQVMVELMSKDGKVYIGNDQGIIESNVSELMPLAFDKESL